MAASSSDGLGAAPTSAAAMPMSAMSAPAKLSFYDFPAEVRLEIYEMLFCYSGPIQLVLDNDGKIKRDDTHLRWFASIPVHAFTVAKKFGQEAASVLYQRNKFSMDWENLRKFLPKWDQGLSSHLGAITIFCAGGPAWGFVSVTRKLADKMPGLREIHFELWGSLRLAAAALETSSAITPCASVFPGPELELAVQPIKFSLYDAGKGGPDFDAIRTTLRRDYAKLADIWPQNLPTSSITRFFAPNLSVIRFSGRISSNVLTTILRHRCLPGDCFWKDVTQELKEGHTDKLTGERKNCGQKTKKQDSDPNGSFIYYKWTAKDPLERTDIPEVNMRQWYPPLTEREKQKVRDFAKAFEKRDNSGPDDDSSPGEHETVGHKSESASEMNALPKGAVPVTGSESTDHGGPTEDASSANAENKEAGSAQETESASTASADEVLRDLRELAFADCFEELDSEALHKDPEDVRDALLYTFGFLGLDYPLRQTPRGF
ncbi:uncharacterized protein PV07_08511 [Cladophialophora immunda]|uniref:Uncharacterized protein n=1 Tax=Cladophialophora immunda TaxID=569365 RepID=A0A0D2CP44_9EURO|nr:uncharacterized protein PV07_08511 [Cladophialophora immunda]KIW25324.1 hypothetical protein PV07_08511 [Cladophialophora immunda]OQV03301.1 hypothetical protein CLAIMM_08354 [Cladophialophora immunda]